MTQPGENRDEATLDWIDDVADRFEATWHERASIRDFLRGADAANELPLLVELIKVDLECRWRGGETRRLETYFEEFPALAGVDQAIRDSLIRHASRVAQKSGSQQSGSQQAGSPQVDENQAHPKILGKFEVIEVVGAGSFGRVYRARDVELDRTVALKVPRSGSFATADEETRFLREARSVSCLHHPGIVKLHDIGHDGDTPFIVCDFIAGRTLAAALAEHCYSPRDAAELIKRIAEALDYAHQNNVVHRDIKPTNILIDREGWPHITDFGLARGERGEASLTLDGQVLGTPAYMSPEQARGDSARVDRRCDVYSLGVILYELLTREPPFRGSLQVVLRQVLEDEPRSIRQLAVGVPRDLETICLKAMSKLPARRYETAGALAADLTRFLAGDAVSARPVSSPERLWRWSRRNPLLAGLACAVASLLLAIATVALWSRNEIAQSAAQTQMQLSLSLAERGTQLLNEGNPNGLFDLLAARDALRDDQPPRRSRELLLDTWTESLAGLLVEVYGHDSPVLAVAISSTGKWLATGATDGTVRLWRAEDGGLEREFRLETRRADMLELEFAADGKQLLATSAQETRVWEVPSGVLKFEILAFPARFGPGRTLAAVTKRAGKRQLAIWNLETGELLKQIAADGDVGLAMTYSPRHRYFAFVSLDSRRARVLRTDDLSIVLEIEHAGAIDAIAFSPDEKLLATASWDQTAQLWSTETGQQIGGELRHDEDVRDLAFSSDGLLLATASLDGRIRIWDTANAELRRAITHHGTPVEFVRFRPPDNLVLASVHRDNAVRLWGIAEGLRRGWQLPHQRKITSLEFSADGQRLLTGSDDGTARLWDLTDGDSGARLPHVDRVWSVDFSPDSRRLATLSERGEICIWQQTAGRWEKERRVPCPDEQTTSLEFSSDGKYLAIGVGKNFGLWNLDTQAMSWLPATALRNPSGFRSIAFAAGGQFVAGGTDDAEAVLVNQRDGREASLPHPFDDGRRYHSVWDVEFHPTRPWLATASEDGIVRLWDTEFWDTERESLLAELPHGDSVAAIAFSDAGDLLATAPKNQPVRIWQLDGNSWRVARQLTGLFADVQALDFSPGGLVLATASDNGEVRMWDTATGLPCGRAYSASPYATAVRFSPDGRWLAAGASNKTARVWALPPSTRAAQHEEFQQRVGRVTGARRQAGVIQAIPWQAWRAARDRD